jgi:hypothetical protein
VDSFSFKEHLIKKARAKTALVKMLEKILRSENSGNVSKETIIENKHLLSDLSSYFDSVENVKITDSKSLKEILNEEFLRGYSTGKKETEQRHNCGVPDRYFDREEFRSFHELEVRTRERHLF